VSEYLVCRLDLKLLNDSFQLLVLYSVEWEITVDDTFRRPWKKVAMAYFNVVYHNFQRVLGKISYNFQDTSSTGRESNPRLSEEIGVVITQQLHSAD
jgi:hypothetical protein